MVSVVRALDQTTGRPDSMLAFALFFDRADVGTRKRILLTLYEGAATALKDRPYQRQQIRLKHSLFSDREMNDAIVAEFWHEHAFALVDLAEWTCDAGAACAQFMRAPWKPTTSVSRINKILDRLSRSKAPSEIELESNSAAVEPAAADALAILTFQKAQATKLLDLAIAQTGEDARLAQTRRIGAVLLDLLTSPTESMDHVDWILPNLTVNAAGFAAWLGTRGVRVSDKTAGKAWTYFRAALVAAVTAFDAELSHGKN